MIKQECIGIPDMILLLMKVKAEIVLSPDGAYFFEPETSSFLFNFGVGRLFTTMKAQFFSTLNAQNFLPWENCFSRFYFQFSGFESRFFWKVISLNHLSGADFSVLF